ncbi:box C/D snoRNA protein 1 isoform 1-T1 [Synchiropus picturatus]
MCSVTLPTTDVMSSVVEERSPEDELRGKKRKIALSHCGVCGSDEAKYRCPGCLTYSCSFDCVKKHKEVSKCSGVRDKTAFVKLTQFDEMTLLSDYRFLEDTGRFADAANRDQLIRARPDNPRGKHLAAKARSMNITLRSLPKTFTRSRENSTFFHKKEKQFYWHLKLIFPQSSTEISQRRVSDKQSLEQILTRYIHPTESDPVMRQKLKLYVHSPSEDISVFMKGEGRKANSVRFHQLDMQKSLRDNLSYKMLIEYPVLHVVLREHWRDYPLKGPAETDTTRSKETEEVSPPSSHIIGSTATSKTSPESVSPQRKRAKKEGEKGDLEEGEVTDSSDDEDQHQRGGELGEDSVSHAGAHVSRSAADKSESPADTSGSE